MCRCAYPKQHKADLSVRQDVSVWPQILNHLSNNYTSIADSDVASAQGEQAEEVHITLRSSSAASRVRQTRVSFDGRGNWIKDQRFILDELTAY